MAEEDVSADILRYLDAELPRLDKGEHAELARQAGGLFIYAATAVRYMTPQDGLTRAQASPTGTACLIGKAGLLGRVVKRFSARSCTPWGAKTSQMGVSNPATPKYEISCPNIPPNVRNSEHNHPPATSGIVYMYLLLPPTPAEQSCPIIHPCPPIRHPRHINNPTH